jgi:hypothetical protein
MKAFVPPAPPISLKEDVNFLRESAEYRVQTPDFGVLAETGGKRTAHEIAAIQTQQGTGIDLKARVIRLDLRDTYRMAWALLLQYGKESTLYLSNGQTKTIDPEIVCDCYVVTPAGSTDSWDTNAKRSKSWNRYMQLRGDPYVNQGELRKDVLASDEAGLLQRLYQEPQDQQAGEAEEQAMELSIMEMGFPAVIDPTDDDKTHLITMAQYFDQKQRNGEPIRPRTARLGLKHGADHTNALMQKKDPALKQLNQQMLPMIQTLQQIAAQPDPAEMQASNVVPMNGAPMQQGQPLAGAGQGAASPSAPVPAAPDDSGKQAPALMQGLASLKKAGVPITFDDINAVLAKAGLPPLQVSPPIPAVTPNPQPNASINEHRNNYANG